MGTVKSARTPPSAIVGPSNRRGSMRSAILPPLHAPTAIPASTVPITDVYVSRLIPTYGASKRPARISSMSTAAEHTNTSAAAMSAGIRQSRAGVCPDV
jgi:hypothetical protein